MLELSPTSKCQLLATNQEDMTPKIKIERRWGVEGNKHNVFGFVKPYYNVKTNLFILFKKIMIKPAYGFD